MEVSRNRSSYQIGCPSFVSKDRLYLSYIYLLKSLSYVEKMSGNNLIIVEITKYKIGVQGNQVL